ncbi:MAG: sugar phosphate isomerase/epimerase [Paraglaciecola sp.]|jgi:sugar phosphate isomerase/epimerase
MNRRNMLKAVAASILLPCFPAYASKTAEGSNKQPLFDISLSQWSFHRAIFGNSRDDYAWYLKTLHSVPDLVLKGVMDPREITEQARKLGVEQVDLANTLWFGHANDKPWLNEFKVRANNDGITFKLLMCDETGSLGSSKKSQRQRAIENHLPWFNAAAELGCSQIRVNAYGDGKYLAQLQQNAESLQVLGELGQQYKLEVLVENHGHASNNGAWLAMLMEMTNHENVGVFTDLDNFFMGGWDISPQRLYDRTQGVIDLAPYTRGVSAKAHHFTAQGQESTIDYAMLLKILVVQGFNGTVSAEFEGDHMSEFFGSEATVKLLKSMQYEV